MSKNKYFDAALGNFIKDFAAGDSIRAYADKGYTVEEIYSKLDYPIERKQIGEIVWKHFSDTGVILFSDPKDNNNEPFEIKKVYDSFGKPSFKKVKKEAQNNYEYILCDFGKRMYKDALGFNKKLELLDKKDAEYILGLPWPIENVWHKKDERMERINAVFNNQR